MINAPDCFRCSDFPKGLAAPNAFIIACKLDPPCCFAATHSQTVSDSSAQRNERFHPSTSPSQPSA